MTVTEIALLHLSQGVMISDADVRSKLAHARTVMQEVEDPSCIYIIGEWDSLDQHTNDFIPSAENQALLENLKELLSVEWLLHIDASHAALPLPASAQNQAKASVYALVRHYVKNGQRAQFQETYENEKRHLQAFVTEGTIGGGWLVDNDGDEEVWMLLTPWTSVEQHHAFAETAGFAEYGRIREHIEGAEIKHARILDM
jgi:heme-degrading monooxygenase HmoA